MATTLGVGTTGSASTSALAPDKKSAKTVGVSRSPRKGKTTTAALNACPDIADFEWLNGFR